jgi:AP-1 complex subunit beta-1
MAIVTAAVKLYLKLEDEAEELVSQVLKLATDESDNPDLRNRGYIYWRMLSEDPEAAK